MLGVAAAKTRIKPGLLVFISACSLWIPGWIGAVRAVTALSPLPVLTVIPALFFGSPAVAAVVPIVFFLMWNPGLLRGEDKIPKRSLVLLAILGLLSVVWFAFGWNDGVQYEGASYVHVVCAVNIAWIVLLGAAFVRYMKRELSFVANLVLHWLLFVWIAWYAFPYLGETP